MNPEIKGEGKLLIFLNDGEYGKWMWDKVISALASECDKSFKIITYNYDGFGGKPGMFKDIDQEVQKLKGLIDSEKTGESVCLVGHGIGAQIALKATDCADYIVAISALNEFSPLQMKSVISSYKQKRLLNRFSWFSKRMAENRGIPSDLYEFYLEDSRSVSSQWLTNMIVSNMTFEIEKVNDDKVTVAVGDMEGKLMLSSACKLSSQPVIVTGAKHDIPFKYPELVVKWILKGM